jgi:tetratricopeptide (TPR) repeat protein
MTTLPTGPDLAELSDEELAEERDFLLRSLRDLDDERGAGDVEDGDYDVLKEGYTARAAAVLRVLDARAHGAEPEEEAPPPTRPWWRRRRALAVGAGVAAFAVGAGLLVAHNAGQRLPGDTVSGSAPNNKVDQLLVQAGNDVQARNIRGALTAYHDALQLDPRNVEALANQGWLVAILGNTANDRALMDQGLANIRQAEQVDPSYASAHFYGGSVLLQEGDAKGAAVEFQAYLDDDPTSPQAALVRQDLQTAQALAAGKLPPGANAGPTTTAP